MSFSTSFWPVEEFERHRLDSRHNMGRESSRVGQARDDAGLGQWTMNESMGLELCRLASRYAVATLQNFRTCAWSLAVSPVALTRWGDKLWSSTQWDCGWAAGRAVGYLGTQAQVPT